MDIVYLLVPMSAVLVLGIVIVLWWAIDNDQFENLEAMGSSILEDDTQPAADEPVALPVAAPVATR